MIPTVASGRRREVTPWSAYVYPRLSRAPLDVPSPSCSDSKPSRRRSRADSISVIDRTHKLADVVEAHHVVDTGLKRGSAVLRGRYAAIPGLFLLWGSFALGGQWTRFLGRRHRIVVRIVSVAGLLEMLLQLFLRLPAALTYGPHLLRGRRGVGVLVRAVILRAVSNFLTHTEIVPPRVSVGKTPLHVQPNDMSNRTTAAETRRQAGASTAQGAGCRRTLHLGTRQTVKWRNRSTPSSPRDKPV